MNSSPPRHLVTVWNPSYAASAMDAHLAILLEWAQRRERGEVPPDDVYVWWAKLRSANRTGPLPHTAEVLALEQQIAAEIETHLYLTDYRSLYVAHLDEVTADNVPDETEDELEHMPEYYRGRNADFWFRVVDIRRLVADDTEGTIAELRHLRNTRYSDRPVSLYGGMVDLPLIVTRDEETKWFSGAEPLTGGKLWAERDAQLRGETEKMEHELRDNLLGRVIWEALEAASRAFLGSGEAVFRARRSDPGFDFSGPALEYAKTVETELNVLIFPALRRWLKGKKPAERETRVDGVPLDLGGPFSHQTLGTIRTLLAKDDIVRRTLLVALPHDAKWLLGELPPRLVSLTNLRNPAAHGAELGSDAATKLRDDVLGVGCEGLLVRIAGAKLRARP
jgi:hypothetical protein